MCMQNVCARMYSLSLANPEYSIPAYGLLILLCKGISVYIFENVFLD